MAIEYTKIQSALNYHLSNMADCPDVVAYENRSAEPVDSELYLISKFNPNQLTYPDVGDAAKSKQSGTFQVFVAGPPGDGWGNVYSQADDIVERFNAGTVIHHNGINVRILSSYPGPGIMKDARYQVPVNIKYFGYY